ncbi:hypothetical protein NHQ30_009030 [Ciborinia camelliae]|nr:hypothetical protein NHQ30_009030 [Ciborinia camelliae]
MNQAPAASNNSSSTWRIYYRGTKPMMAEGPDMDKFFKLAIDVPVASCQTDRRASEHSIHALGASPANLEREGFPSQKGILDYNIKSPVGATKTKTKTTPSRVGV